MNCVILQPSYIPWRGYFHQIQKADVFVFYDDVQFDKHGWRNRNRVKGPQGSQWLTIPVLSKNALINHIPINEIRIDWGRHWNKKHWMTISSLYARAPYFNQYRSMLETFYTRNYEKLADFTIDLTVAIARELGLRTEFVKSSSLRCSGHKTDRLREILLSLGAKHYISGPSARGYLEEEKLTDAGISLEYMTYAYPDYPQFYPPFDPQVSILDLMFMVGPDAPKYVWDPLKWQEPEKNICYDTLN